MYSNRKPYYQLKKSMTDFFSGYSRFIKQSLTKESVAEKPYLEGEYPQMHLNLPGFEFEKFKRRGLAAPTGGFGSELKWAWSKHIFSDPSCYLWRRSFYNQCIEGIVDLSGTPTTFWKDENLQWNVRVVKDSAGGVAVAGIQGDDIKIFFPEQYSGTAVVCATISTYTLLSATFRTIAGIPVTLNISPTNGLRFLGPVPNSVGGYTIGEAQLLQTVYGQAASDPCCITLASLCDPCTDLVAVSWDYTNSAATIAQSASVSIFVADGLGPFNWEVTGTGFTLGSAQTATGENTLISDASACGTATITVTDVCPDSCTGYVRCTTGEWAAYSSNVCELSGAAAGYTINAATCWITVTGILGNLKQIDVFEYAGSVQGCANSAAMCMDFSGYCPPACGSGLEPYYPECGSNVGCINSTAPEWNLYWTLSSRVTYEWVCA